MNNSALTNSTQDTPRVAIIYRLDQPGGVQSVVLSLIKGLNRRGIVPDLVWDSAPDQDLLDEKGVEAGYLPVTLPAPSFLIDQAPISARYILRAGNVFTSQSLSKTYDFYYIFYNGFLVTDDTPHVRYLSGPPLLPQLEVVPRGLRGVPFRLLRWIYRRFLRERYPAYEVHADSPYVINSQYTADLFEEAHGVRLPVIHPPIALDEFSYDPGDLPKRDTATFFSRIVDYKRPEYLLRLAEEYPAMRFILMGGVKADAREYYEKLRAGTEHLQNVTFLENPSRERVKEELARTRFFIFPGLNEHFGMATAEAIAAGAVPYVHDSGGQREVVPDPRLRFTDDVFVDRFKELAAMPDDALNEIRQRLNEHIRQFSEETFIDKMLAFLNQPHQLLVESEYTI